VTAGGRRGLAGRRRTTTTQGRFNLLPKTPHSRPGAVLEFVRELRKDRGVEGTGSEQFNQFRAGMTHQGPVAAQAGAHRWCR